MMMRLLRQTDVGKEGDDYLRDHVYLLAPASDGATHRKENEQLLPCIFSNLHEPE